MSNMIQVKDTAGFNNWFNLADVYFIVRSKNEAGKLVTKIYIKPSLCCEVSESVGKYAIAAWEDYLNRGQNETLPTLSKKTN